MSIETIVEKIAQQGKTSLLNKALALLWYYNSLDSNVTKSASDLSRLLIKYGLGNPNVTRLRDHLRNSKHTISVSGRFRLTKTAFVELSRVYAKSTYPVIDHYSGYIPKEVWENTKKYIEDVARQVNGCYEYGFYDASDVMLRRLIESLLIEAYEKTGNNGSIKEGENYMMLNGIIGVLNKGNEIHLGRDSRKTLILVKKLGDRSAHNRYFRATKADLDKINDDVRLLVDELISISELHS